MIEMVIGGFVLDVRLLMLHRLRWKISIHKLPKVNSTTTTNGMHDEASINFGLEESRTLPKSLGLSQTLAYL